LGQFRRVTEVVTPLKRVALLEGATIRRWGYIGEEGGAHLEPVKNAHFSWGSLKNVAQDRSRGKGDHIVSPHEGGEQKTHKL